MKNKEEIIQDIKLEEGATYGFIGGLTFLGVMFLVGGQETAILMEAILAGGAAAVFSVATSYLTIGRYFAAKRRKISQNLNIAESSEELLTECEKIREEPLKDDIKPLKMADVTNLYPTNPEQVMIRQRKKK